MLVSRAGDETRSQDERLRDMKSIQNLGTVFQSDVDLGPSVHRLKHVYEQSILNEPLDRKLATTWIQNGLASFITEEVDEKAHSVFTSLRHDLVERPAQIALTDWLSEIGSRTTSRPRYEDLDKHPIFKSILQENLPELQHQLTRIKNRPPKLRYKHYDLLNFAIINCQPKICRYLCLEHSFMFTYNEGGQEAIEACINDTSAVILSEFDSFSALAHEKRSQSAVDKTDEIPISLNVRLLYPPCLALLAQRGSAMAMELTQSLVSDALGLLNKLIQQNWVDQFEGIDSVNPLLSSLHTRRLTPFLRLLQTGRPDNALFPLDSVIFGMPILIHAITSLAPFFVAALLAYGADANTSVDMSGFKVSALQMVCMETCLEGYTTSLEQRLEFHEQCGFDDFVIRRDRAEIKSAQQDASSQRILIAELLISYGADINGRPVAEWHGQDNATTTAIGSETPLSLAIECGDIELACFLIRAGTDLSILSKGRTPLLQAICHDHVQIIECLLEQHVMVNDVRGGISPLAYATCLARHEIFRLLLQGGSDLMSAEPTGEILFHQVLELTSEQCSDQEEVFANLSTTEERLRLRPILAEYLKTLAPADLRVLMQTESAAGTIAMHYAVRWISGQNEGGADLLSLILSNTDNLHAITEDGHDVVMLGLALSNLWFIHVWNMAVFLRMLI